jgi:hypothetical protein
MVSRAGFMRIYDQSKAIFLSSPTMILDSAILFRCDLGRFFFQLFVGDLAINTFAEIMLFIPL